MLNLGLQLGLSDNWSSVISYSRNAVLLNPEPPLYQPIPNITIPFLLDDFILVIFVDSDEKKPKWFTGGYVRANVRTGLTIGGQSDTEVHFQRLSLGKLNLVRVPEIAPEYELQLISPYWFKDVTFNIWGYVGGGFGSVEGKVDEIGKNLEPINTQSS